MYKSRTFLAIIPAREGSKRLPRKNILGLNGKPLIAWSIEAGLRSKYIDEVVVSTDNRRIAEISAKFGATIPFIRPAYLSTDDATSFNVVRHAIEFYKNNLKKEFDFVVLLQPTSPLRNSLDIDNAIKLLMQKEAEAVISVCESNYPPFFINVLPGDLSMDNFLKNEIKNKKRQDFPKYHQLNGAIYINNIKRLLEEKTFFISDNIYAYIMPRERSVDIDSEFDLKLAEAIMQNR